MSILTWFIQSFRRPQGRPLVCSGCLTITPRRDAVVMPLWSDTDFTTAFRCKKCRAQAFEEIFAKLRELDEPSKLLFCEFLTRHRLTEMAESLRNAQISEARDWTIKFVEQVRDGSVQLNP